MAAILGFDYTYELIIKEEEFAAKPVSASLRPSVVVQPVAPFKEMRCRLCVAMLALHTFAYAPFSLGSPLLRSWPREESPQIEQSWIQRPANLSVSCLGISPSPALCIS